MSRATLDGIIRPQNRRLLKQPDSVILEQPRLRPPRKKGGRLLHSALNGMLYILIVGGVVFGLPRILSHTLQTPFPMAAITSGSMWPELKIGDLVLIHGVTKKEDIQVGDIIVYNNRDNHTMTIHRVMELRSTTLVTKGDANFDSDMPARYEDVIGKTVNFSNKPVRIPYMGSITVYASNLKR